MPHPPSWFDWLTVIAIVLGPILALFAQRWLDLLREKKNRRVQLYMTLMLHRATPLHTDHINAVNLIDVVFDGRRDQKIRDARQKLMDHIFTDESLPGWYDRANDLRADLYQAIGSSVGYEFTTDYLKRLAYAPVYQGNKETQENRIRQMLAESFTEDGLKVSVSERNVKAVPASKTS